MKTIWKYELDAPGKTFDMPKNAKILCVKVQRENVCIWALVDPDQESEKRYFIAYGTDFKIRNDEGLIYIGTVMFDSHNLVFHIFERLAKGN